MKYFYAVVIAAVVVGFLAATHPRPAHAAAPVETCVWPHVC